MPSRQSATEKVIVTLVTTKLTLKTIRQGNRAQRSMTTHTMTGNHCSLCVSATLELRPLEASVDER